MSAKPTIHRLYSAPGHQQSVDMGIAFCGAKRRDGAKFSPNSRNLTCQACKAVVFQKQAEAKARVSQEAGAQPLPPKGT